MSVPDDLRSAALRLASTGQTVVWVGWDGQARGLLGLSDSLSPESSAVVAGLQRMSIEVVMLTGDNAASASATARRLGIGRVLADVVPHEKANEVRRLQEGGHTVAMVGDGINDAPALVQADLGIAVGAATHVAMESADVVLISSDLAGVPTALRLAVAGGGLLYLAYVSWMARRGELGGRLAAALVGAAIMGIVGLTAVARPGI